MIFRDDRWHEKRYRFCLVNLNRWQVEGAIRTYIISTIFGRTRTSHRVVFVSSEVKSDRGEACHVEFFGQVFLLRHIDHSQFDLWPLKLGGGALERGRDTMAFSRQRHVCTHGRTFTSLYSCILQSANYEQTIKQTHRSAPAAAYSFSAPCWSFLFSAVKRLRPRGTACPPPVARAACRRRQTRRDKRPSGRAAAASSWRFTCRATKVSTRRYEGSGEKKVRCVCVWVCISAGQVVVNVFVISRLNPPVCSWLTPLCESRCVFAIGWRSYQVYRWYLNTLCNQRWRPQQGQNGNVLQRTQILHECHTNKNTFAASAK